MRAPLALRLSAATRAALVRKARAAGVDPAGPEFAGFVGDLLAAELPDALGEAADELIGAPARERLGAHLPFDAATPPALAEGATSTSITPEQVGSSVADLDAEDGPGATVD